MNEDRKVAPLARFTRPNGLIALGLSGGTTPADDHLMAPGPANALSSYVDGEAWICVFCTSRNALGVDPCGTCGLSFKGGARPDVSDAGRAPRRTLLSSRTASLPAEIGVAAGLFALWRLGDVAAGSHTSGAVRRGRELWSVERSLHIPSERSFQRLLLPHTDLLHALDGYYAVAHLGGMASVAGWLFLRHRSSYGRWRNAVVLSTAACFALQLIAVAPPRLVPGLGLVDTARIYGESVYGHGGLSNQVSSMPSVHFGWALLVAAIVMTAGTTRKRYVVALHPLLTLLAIVATANHYWLDAVVAALVTLACVRMTRPTRGP